MIVYKLTVEVCNIPKPLSMRTQSTRQPSSPSIRSAMEVILATPVAGAFTRHSENVFTVIKVDKQKI